MSDGWIVIPRWEEFQHYGKREPVWIKNHTRLIHNDAYLKLTAHQRGVLHGLWMVYATSHRQIADNTATVSRQLGVRVSRATLEALNDAGFIQLSASRPLALTRSKQKQKNREEVDVKAETAAQQSTARLPADLVDQVTHLNGADDRTLAVLTQFVRKGLPEAAFRNALEATRQAHTNRRLRGSEVAYFVGTLRQLANSGQYQ